MLKKLLFSICSLPIFLSAELLVDNDFSPYMGSADLYFALETVQKAEDWLIPEGASERRPTLSQFGRLGELVAYWFLNAYLDVAQHEIFGHGYRIRSLGKKKATVLQYIVSWSGGATGFEFSPNLTTGEFNAISGAGLEAEMIFSDYVKHKWIDKGYVDARQGALYNLGRLSPISYALIDRNSKIVPSTDVLEGHDIKSYAAGLNLLYPGLGMTQTKILQYSLLNLVDPTIYNTYWSYFRYFIWGKNASLWHIPFGQYKYLPYLTMDLAPYGPETAIMNILKGEGRSFTFYVKGGRMMTTGYGGFGIKVDPLIENHQASLGFIFDFWAQPNFLKTPSISKWMKDTPQETPISGHTVGSHLGALVRVNLTKSKDYQFLLQGGYKTGGYLPGYSLSPSPYGRVGMRLTY